MTNRYGKNIRHIVAAGMAGLLVFVAGDTLEDGLNSKDREDRVIPIQKGEVDPNALSMPIIRPFSDPHFPIKVMIPDSTIHYTIKIMRPGGIYIPNALRQRDENESTPQRPIIPRR